MNIQQSEASSNP